LIEIKFIVTIYEKSNDIFRNKKIIYNKTIDMIELITPFITPSVTKGNLINNGVAPTNFIICISVSLEKTVSLIVFDDIIIAKNRKINESTNPRVFEV
jgi:hypothetical protein